MAVVERPMDRPSGESVDRDTGGGIESGFWARPLIPTVPLDRETAAYIALVLLAGLLRFWDLGSRMLHHDESLHAVYSYYLYIGKGYIHDPMMHGPFLFELNALVYFLLGATDATTRVAPALFGTILVALPYFLRERLGRTAALVATLLLTISPTILYYSRFIRHDIYQIFFMMLLVIATFRYLRTRWEGWLFLAAATTSLAFANKEDTYFLLAILLSFLFLIRPRDVFEVILTGKPATHPATDVLILIGTLILPLFAAVPYFVVHGQAEGTIDLVFGLSLLVLFGLGAFIGLRWNRRVWGRSAILFWGIFIVLYTTFFSNPGGLSSGIFGSLRYWIDQQGVARGAQPMYYYLVLLPMYEFLAVGVVLASAVYWIRQRILFVDFLLYWCAISLILWGWASEKMPWMVVEMSLPFILLAALTIGRLIEGADWRKAARAGGAPLALTLSLAILAGAAILGQGVPLSAASPIQAQHQLFQWIALVATFIVLAYLSARLWSKVGSPIARRLMALTVIGILFVFTVRAAWQVSYYHGDIPVEMLVYTQTAPDVGQVMKQIDDIAYRSGEGKGRLAVTYDSGVSWPFEWYLRDYPSRVFIGEGSPPPNAPVVLVGMENGRETQIKQQLGERYVSQRYRLRWWFPEETTYRNLTVGKIASNLLNPASRAALWRFIMYRQLPTDLGSTDFVLFVRRDLAYGPWAAPQAMAQASAPDLYEQRTRNLSATSSFGGASLGLNSPRGVAVDFQGNIYIADTLNSRIVVLAPNGQMIRAWGTKGIEPGQFNEPWSVAVGPKGQIYVADTWNHRIQEFDSNGAFIRSWGSEPAGQPQTAEGSFYGPRAIVVDPSGNVYVTDTGNKRIQKFDPTGKFLGAYGAPGAGLGFFDEPVGLAIDRQGNFYVADTWNHRIQKFGPDFTPLTSWPIVGWDSQSVVEKPYLAVDAAGNVYATDPEASQVIAFDPNGTVLAVWGKLGSDAASLRLPTGIAVDANGNIYIADSDNGRIQRFAPIR